MTVNESATSSTTPASDSSKAPSSNRYGSGGSGNASERPNAPRSMLSGSRGAKATAPDTSPSGPEPNAPASAENGAFRGTVPLGPDGKPLPEWIDVPEQFVRDTGIDWKGLVDSYKHLRARLSKREDELKAKLLEELRAEREKALSGELEEVYPLRASEGVLPEGVELVGDDERDTAFVAEMRAWAKSVGLMPDQWRELVDKFAKWRLSRLPDPRKEIEALGPKGAERVAAVDGYLRATLTPEQYEAISSVVFTKAAFEAIETLVNATVTPSPARVGGAREPELSEDEIRKLMSSPFYWELSERGRKIRETVDRYWASRAKGS